MIRKATRAELLFMTSLNKSSNRRESGLFVAEGEKVVGELIGSKIKIKWVVALQSYLDEHVSELSNYECLSVSPSDLERISSFSTPNQVFAVAEIPIPAALNFKPSGQTFLLLDGIADPGNLGTLVRTSEWFGIDAVIATTGSVDFWNPKAVQAAMGSLFRMPVYHADALRILSDAKSAGIRFQVGGVLDGAPMNSVHRTTESMIIVVGSESHGISKEVQAGLSHAITISKAKSSPTESLNATIAAGVLMYHFLPPKF